MASKHVRTGATKITTSYRTPDNDVIDMGAFRVVSIQCRRLKNQGSSSILTIEHNSTKDEDGWVASAVSFNLNGTGSDFAERDPTGTSAPL